MVKNYKLVLTISCFLFFLIVFLIINEPLIELKGEAEINLNLNDDYVEKGYIGKTRIKKMTNKVIVDSNINNKKIGTYEMKYKLKYLWNTKTVIRKVNVVDHIKPEIKLKGQRELKMCPNAKYIEEGYEVTDNYTNNLEKKVQIERTNKEIIYKVKDSSGNEDIKTRKIISTDSESPILNLKGEDFVVIKQGDKFEDPGYSAIDNCEGDITNKVLKMGFVDTKHNGINKITYVVKDITGNETRKYRMIYVTNQENINNGIIYLTFDDGPSRDITPTILDILKEENINATFFVTDRPSDLDYLIKREKEENHTVALHTATHNYSYVYSSPEAYFTDLQMVSDKVKRITGMESKIIRFPGGGSNLVSKKYSPGIMTYLTREVENRGYHYYDWNVDSGDATRRYNSDEIYTNVTSALKPGRENIVLMHDFAGNNATKDALKRIIQYGKDNGYVFASITENTKEIHHLISN